MTAKPRNITALLCENRYADALIAAWDLSDPLLAADRDLKIRRESVAAQLAAPPQAGDLEPIKLRDLVFRACCGMASNARASHTGRNTTRRRIEGLLARFPPPNFLVADSRDPPSLAQPIEGYRSLVMRAHLQSVLATLNATWSAVAGAVATPELEAVVAELETQRTFLMAGFGPKQAGADSMVRQDDDRVHRAAAISSQGSQPAATDSAAESLPPIPLGFIRDLTELLLGNPVRPAIRRERCQVPLIEHGAEGVIGNLDLELVADGRGEMYIHPELAFVYRDEMFRAGERAAWEHTKRVFAETAERRASPPDPDMTELAARDGVPADTAASFAFDVRWRLSLRSALQGEKAPSEPLTGNSAGGAFGLGTLKLLA